ncbi:uncharacterized protein N7459_009370 [Penicillium hispanicum]|uniref:uncharacterized protein n=1 Tax=Penicillium hispanicum TaxID=1080232 RepID=UPI00253FCFA2|nr:uncharacterized protein N7459_009370 [Penicillium hispanicum]KAJ5569940.1 hypothetical protein N7459_009370 [Penicillium hispanicum]
MPAPRTITFLLHPSHTSVCASPPLHPRSSRPLSTLHTTNHKRPTRPRHTPRHGPANQPTILFSSTPTFRAREPNYYEILDLPITATAAEIKKKFYALSLRHHPDRNRTDPDASQRFARISAAYHVLGNAGKRATYDRDHGIHHAAHRSHPAGSHSSHAHHKGGGGSYAGSRPASGLSKRRGTFRGPPPSFYAQGGYGATGRTAEGGFASAGSFAGAGAAGGGFGAGQTQTRRGQRGDPEDPTGFIDRNPLGYFNARGHFRTQKAEDLRRSERRSRAMRDAVREEDAVGAGGEIGIFRFVVVCGIMVAAGAMSGLFKWSTMSADGGKTTKRQKEASS